MRFIRLLAGIGLLGMMSWALAQTGCPQGVGAGSARCGPGGGTMSPGSSGPRRPSVRWVSQWGAYAEDSTRAIVGSAVEKRSKRAAERAAIKRCKEIGGGNECKVMMTYTNGCGVVLEPAEPLYVMYGVYQWGATVEEALEKGLPQCVEANEGHACKIVHKSCSKAYTVED